jgi:hypothetical protein
LLLSIPLAVLGIGLLIRSLRWTVAGTVGFLSGLTTCLAAWVGFGDTDSMRWQRNVQHQCMMIQDDLKEFSETHGSFPQSLSDLEDLPHIEPQPNGETRLSGTDQIITYERLDSGYRIVWLGRDGTAGGIGLDADLEFNQESRRFPNVRLPFLQFLLEAPGSAGLGGGLYATRLLTIAILLDQTPISHSRSSWIALDSLFLLSSGLAYFLASVLTQASQSGH